MTKSKLFETLLPDIRLGIQDAIEHCSNNVMGIVGDKISKKTYSEILSSFVAAFIQERCEGRIKGVECLVGKSDNDNDMVFLVNGERVPLEIKVTCSHQWRGGEFSGRECDHLMIFWDINKDGEWKTFACISNLTKNDWNSQIDSGYYGTVLHRWVLAEDKKRLDVAGSILSHHLAGKRKMVKIDYAKVRV